MNAQRRDTQTEMNVTNKSKRALSVPLPNGKTLFLGLGKTGQITKKSAKHPPLVELVEAGDLEIDETSRKRKVASSGGSVGPSGGQSGAPASDFRRTGDR